jgi:hypothetical protein
VAIGPGATQFAVIPVPLSSFASIFVIVSTAAFDAVYVAEFGLNAPTDELDNNMILPPPPCLILFAASLKHKNVPLQLTLKQKHPISNTR